MQSQIKTLMIIKVDVDIDKQSMQQEHFPFMKGIYEIIKQNG